MASSSSLPSGQGEALAVLTGRWGCKGNFIAPLLPGGHAEQLGASQAMEARQGQLGAGASACLESLPRHGPCAA